MCYFFFQPLTNKNTILSFWAMQKQAVVQVWLMGHNLLTPTNTTFFPKQIGPTNKDSLTNSSLFSIPHFNFLPYSFCKLLTLDQFNNLPSLWSVLYCALLLRKETHYLHWYCLYWYH